MEASTLPATTFCPKCSSSEVKAMPPERDYSNPLAKQVYVYKCVCGVAFTSYNSPEAPEERPSQPR